MMTVWAPRLQGSVFILGNTPQDSCQILSQRIKLFRQRALPEILDNDIQFDTFTSVGFEDYEANVAIAEVLESLH